MDDAAHWTAGDVTRFSDADSLVALAVEAFGKLDVVHANAGVSQVAGAAGDITEEEWRRLVAVNLNGVFNTFKAAVPALLRAGNASVITTASGAGLVGVPGQAAYVASKHAVVGFTRSAALDYAGRGIRVNAIAPGYIDTDMIKHLSADKHRERVAGIGLGRVGTPEDVADVVVFLASEWSRYVTGQVIGVDGGMVI